MKKIVLKTVNKKGETILETPLEVKEGSIIIQKVPDKMKLEQIKAVHDWFVEALEKGEQVITLPNNIKHQIIEIVE